MTPRSSASTPMTVEVFAWFREAAATTAGASRRRSWTGPTTSPTPCTTSRTASTAGQVPLARIDRDAVLELAAAAGARTARDLGALYDALTSQPWWVHSYDGTPARPGGGQADDQRADRRGSSAAVVTGNPRGVTVTATCSATAPTWSCRSETRAECELLKAIAVHYVMLGRVAVQERSGCCCRAGRAAGRPRAGRARAGAARASGTRPPTTTPRLRVVIDQVASLTDPSAVAWHARLR